VPTIPKAGAREARARRIVGVDAGASQRPVGGGAQHRTDFIAGITGDHQLDAVVEKVVLFLLGLDLALQRQDAVLLHEVAPTDDLAGFEGQGLARDLRSDDQIENLFEREQDVARLITDEAGGKGTAHDDRHGRSVHEDREIVGGKKNATDNHREPRDDRKDGRDRNAHDRTSRTRLNPVTTGPRPRGLYTEPHPLGQALDSK